jgi:hypothetical protein
VAALFAGRATTGAFAEVMLRVFTLNGAALLELQLGALAAVLVVLMLVNGGRDKLLVGHDVRVGSTAGREFVARTPDEVVSLLLLLRMTDVIGVRH